jgi:hypothetical protein
MNKKRFNKTSKNKEIFLGTIRNKEIKDIRKYRIHLLGMFNISKLR